MKTDNFIETLRQGDIGKNESAYEADISKARVALKLAKMPSLPKEYETIILSFNGLSNEGALLLGVTENNNFFPNIVQYNKDFFKNNKSDFLVLGYDDFYYLIFDDRDKKYKVVDQDDFDEIVASESIYDPLAYLLHIDL